MENKPTNDATRYMRDGEARHISSLLDEAIEKMEKERVPLHTALPKFSIKGGGESSFDPYAAPVKPLPESARKVKADVFTPRERTLTAQPVVLKASSGADLVYSLQMVNTQKQLCGPLWYEGEVCVLFADTNVGKSLLGVQIADMITRGKGCETSLPELSPDTEEQKVVYVDFELSTVQFGRRYSCDLPDGSKKVYGFSPSFYRSELDFSGMIGRDIADASLPSLLFDSVKSVVEEVGAKVLIVDNITYMATSTESAVDALPLMKKFLDLKKSHSLSLLLLAHTPKRSASRPLCINDIQGSKMIANFADSCFAIGKSRQGEDIRYIKQIKQRNTEQIYGSENVIQCMIGHLKEDFIGFMSMGTSHECIHLEHPEQPFSDTTRTDRRAEARKLKESGKTPDEIASELNVSRASVYRWIKEKETA